MAFTFFGAHSLGTISRSTTTESISMNTFVGLNCPNIFRKAKIGGHSMILCQGSSVGEIAEQGGKRGSLFHLCFLALSLHCFAFNPTSSV